MTLKKSILFLALTVMSVFATLTFGFTQADANVMDNVKCGSGLNKYHVEKSFNTMYSKAIVGLFGTPIANTTISGGIPDTHGNCTYEVTVETKKENPAFMFPEANFVAYFISLAHMNEGTEDLVEYTETSCKLVMHIKATSTLVGNVVYTNMVPTFHPNPANAIDPHEKFIENRKKMRWIAVQSMKKLAPVLSTGVGKKRLMAMLDMFVPLGLKTTTLNGIITKGFGGQVEK